MGFVRNFASANWSKPQNLGDTFAVAHRWNRNKPSQSMSALFRLLPISTKSWARSCENSFTNVMSFLYFTTRVIYVWFRTRHSRKVAISIKPMGDNRGFQVQLSTESWSKRKVPWHMALRKGKKAITIHFQHLMNFFLMQTQIQCCEVDVRHVGTFCGRFEVSFLRVLFYPSIRCFNFDKSAQETSGRSSHLGSDKVCRKRVLIFRFADRSFLQGLVEGVHSVTSMHRILPVALKTFILRWDLLDSLHTVFCSQISIFLCAMFEQHNAECVQFYVAEYWPVRTARCCWETWEPRWLKLRDQVGISMGHVKQAWRTSLEKKNLLEHTSWLSFNKFSALFSCCVSKQMFHTCPTLPHTCTTHKRIKTVHRTCHQFTIQPTKFFSSSPMFLHTMGCYILWFNPPPPQKKKKITLCLTDLKTTQIFQHRNKNNHLQAPPIW